MQLSTYMWAVDGCHIPAHKPWQLFQPENYYNRKLSSNVDVKCKKQSSMISNGIRSGPHLPICHLLLQLVMMDLTTFQIYVGRGWLHIPAHKPLHLFQPEIIITEKDATSLFFKQWWGKICASHMLVAACLAALMMPEYCTCPVYGKLVETNAKMAYTTKSQMLPTPPRSDANTLSECWHFDTSVNTLQLCACFKMANGWKNFYRAQ